MRPARPCRGCRSLPGRGAGCGLRAAGCGLRAAGCGLRAAAANPPGAGPVAVPAGGVPPASPLPFRWDRRWPTARGCGGPSRVSARSSAGSRSPWCSRRRPAAPSVRPWGPVSGTRRPGATARAVRRTGLADAVGGSRPFTAGEDAAVSRAGDGRPAGHGGRHPDQREWKYPGYGSGWLRIGQSTLVRTSSESSCGTVLRMPDDPAGRVPARCGPFFRGCFVVPSTGRRCGRRRLPVILRIPRRGRAWGCFPALRPFRRGRPVQTSGAGRLLFTGLRWAVSAGRPGYGCDPVFRRRLPDRLDSVTQGAGTSS
ncbi:hypothetical protein B7R87_00100 [Streptomyces tsukubensis]|nr:hypothetical protein B7R87_00100 [Streptomyces tsukubensis]